MMVEKRDYGYFVEDFDWGILKNFFYRIGGAVIDSFLLALEFLVLLLANFVVGAVGFIPSILITAVNIDSFGLYIGAALTFSGEIFGAWIGFYLYRYGFAKADPKWLRHPFWQRFTCQSTKRIFILVILLRLLPFMPSGFVTAGAALTAISGKHFWIASTIGKIPAVILELAVVYGVIQTVPKNIQVMLFGAILAVSAIAWLKSAKQKKSLQSND